MSDEELAEIERRFQSRIGTDKFLTIFDRDMKDLIAEVRRLKAENEQMAINHEREIARMNGVLDGFDL